MKRKGFTLVELLAVIVILAIIALITTVVVINIIETVKIRKYKVEEKSLEKAAELYYTNSQIFPFQDEISLNTLVEKGYINSVKDTGNGSTCEGKVIKDNNGELKGCLKCSNYVTEGCGYVKDDEKDDDEIKDENPGVICGSGTEEDYDKQTECHIKSVEDLVAFSYLVNSGKTFAEKTVYLDKDLDITNYAKEKSYVDPDKKALYDINGDGEKTSLKDEMTTDKGFQPIGTTSKNQFSGTFDGGAYTISNLMINRPDEDNAGLFGYIGGISSSDYATIIGLNVENISVIGNNYVGGIVGYVNKLSTIKEVTVSGDIKGTGNYVGGIIGSSQSYTNLTNAIVNANVEGNKYVGGLAGSGISIHSGIVEGGTIKGESNVYGSGSGISNSYINGNNVTLTQKTGNPTFVGKTYVDSNYGNLNLYNDYIDTWLGGDNDGSGYYFDYESETSNKIVLRSTDTEKYQINTTFEKGSGTKEDPYLIESYEDMKKLSAVTKEQAERKYYKLTKDLNYEDRHYYMIGTKTSQFKGVFDGGAHTLSNIGVYGYDYVGLFGYISGISSSDYATIIGLNVENINVIGNNYVGGIVGYVDKLSTIKEVTVSGDIKGTGNYAGGIIGSSQSYTNLTNAIVNANVEGTNYVGGLAGSGISTYSGIVESGEIKGTNYVYGSGRYISNTYAYINEKVIKNAPDTASTGWNGTAFPETSYNNLEYYSNLKVGSTPIIETQYSGDTDKSGYYFGYNNATKENIVVIPAVN